MAIVRLDHYSIRTSKLEETRRFYVDIVGLEVGPRPAFDFPGEWLYQGECAVVHLVGVDETDPSGLLNYLGGRDLAATSGSGTIDHVAFVATNAEDMRARCSANNVSYRDRAVPDMNLQQIFLEDPNGVTIELNYIVPAEEGSAWARP